MAIFSRKSLLLIAIPVFALGPNLLCAQDDRPAEGTVTADEEIIVRGQRLADLRLQLQAARVHVYDVFNELNSDDAFDVSCGHEARTGTRIRQHRCRPQFEAAIASEAFREWKWALQSLCPGGLSQECMFGNERAAVRGLSAAQGVEARQGYIQKQFELELARVIRDNPELQEAILEFWAIEAAYDEARGQTRE